MARRTKEEAEATRESVLLAALDLFSEQSCSHATFSDIARRIGMTRGAVYRHFENKPALLAALIEYICDRQRHLTGEPIPAICSIGDVRRAFIAHAGVVASDAMVRRFEFFMHYQMEWSAELLIETHKTLNEFRKNPLDESRVCFQLPAIARCLRDGVNVDPLILTLPAFRVGLCKMYLGRCPRTDFDSRAENGFDLPGGVSLAQMAGGGFDYEFGFEKGVCV